MMGFMVDENELWKLLLAVRIPSLLGMMQPQWESLPQPASIKGWHRGVEHCSIDILYLVPKIQERCFSEGWLSDQPVLQWFLLKGWMVATSRDFRVRTICMSPCQDLAREQHQRTRIWFLWLDQLYPIVLSTLWRIKQGMATSGLFHGPARMGTGDLCGLFQASVWDDDPDCVICFRWVVHSASSDIQIYHIYIYNIHTYIYIYIYMCMYIYIYTLSNYTTVIYPVATTISPWYPIIIWSPQVGQLSSFQVPTPPSLWRTCRSTYPKVPRAVPTCPKLNCQCGKPAHKPTKTGDA